MISDKFDMRDRLNVQLGADLTEAKCYLFGDNGGLVYVERKAIIGSKFMFEIAYLKAKSTSFCGVQSVSKVVKF